MGDRKHRDHRIRGYKMLQRTTADHRVFEVSIYNKEVRSVVRENQSHDYFDDHWADVRVRDVVARDETEARRLIAERFPPDDGFVITDVTPTAF